jgi:hypothetical protein
MSALHRKIAKNPYLMAVLILMCEAVFNATTSWLFAKQLGETNLSFVVWITLAVGLVSTTLKEPVTTAYGKKFIATYFGIICLLMIMSLIGRPALDVVALLLVAVLIGLKIIGGYFYFMFLQKHMVLSMFEGG